MCIVCTSQGVDRKFVNGARIGLFHHHIFGKSKNKKVNIQLCFIHSRELFMIGEKRFLEKYYLVAHALVKNDEDSFGEDEV